MLVLSSLLHRKCMYNAPHIHTPMYALCPPQNSTLGKKSLHSFSHQYSTLERRSIPLHSLSPPQNSILGRRSVPLHSLSPSVQYTGEKECTPTLFVSISTVHWREGAYPYTLCLHQYSTLERRSIPLHSLSPSVQYTGEKEHTPTLFIHKI